MRVSYLDKTCTFKLRSPLVKHLYLIVSLCLIVYLGLPISALDKRDLTTPQAQQLLKQLPVGQQMQVQQALATNSETTTDIKAPSEQVVSGTQKGLFVTPPTASILEKLYEKRMLDNPHMLQLSEAGILKATPLLDTTSTYKQFGYTTFVQTTTTLQSAVPMDDNYVLGPGDEITVYVWGKIEERLDFVLDNTGTIVLPKSGPLQLSGLTFRGAEKLIYQTLAKNFVNFNSQLVLKERRNIQVYLLGQAITPGAFQVPAGTRLTGLLYLTQGPSKQGSLRKIQVLRNNRVIRTIDLYDYLLKGERKHDIVLENDDTILIPPIGDTVAIGGTVSQPGIYELSGNTTSLADMLSFAAGLTWDNYYKRIQLYRIQNGELQRIEDIAVQTPSALAEKTKSLKLKDGDVVMFQPIRQELRNVVTIVGSTVRPGQYQWTPTMTLGALLGKAEGLLPNSLNRVDIYRFVAEDSTKIISLDHTKAEDKAFALQEWDIVQTYGKNALVTTESVTIQGAVRNAGAYPLLENMRLQDLLFMAKLDTVLRAPEIEIVRLNSTGEVSVIPVQIDAAGLATPNVALKPSDDIRVKTFRNAKIQVTISGEVRFPGTYTLSDTAKLTELLSRAGGLTEEAYVTGTVFVRTKLNEHETSGYEKVLRDEQKRLMYDQLQMTAFSETEKQIHEKILLVRAEYIQQLQQIGRQNKGRMVINMKNALTNAPGNKWDLQLENDDVLTIPKIPDYVQIVGGVESPATYQYLADWAWEDYLGKAGGLTKYADREGIKVFHIDGTVSKLGTQLQPGDIVYVPETISIPFNWMLAFKSTVDVLKTIADAVFSFMVIKGVVNGF